MKPSLKHLWNIIKPSLNIMNHDWPSIITVSFIVWFVYILITRLVSLCSDRSSGCWQLLASLVRCCDEAFRWVAKQRTVGAGMMDLSIYSILCYFLLSWLIYLIFSSFLFLILFSFILSYLHLSSYLSVFQPVYVCVHIACKKGFSLCALLPWSIQRNAPNWFIHLVNHLRKIIRLELFHFPAPCRGIDRGTTNLEINELASKNELSWLIMTCWSVY